LLHPVPAVTLLTCGNFLVDNSSCWCCIGGAS
jgi:hypothetical protein